VGFFFFKLGVQSQAHMWIRHNNTQIIKACVWEPCMCFY